MSPQLTREDFPRAAAEGFKLVINNRPDGEAPGQMSDDEAKAAAAAAGLAYLHVPVRGGPTEAQARAVIEAAAAGGKTLAYCRSGTRSTFAWALGAALSKQATPEAIQAAAAGAGYDVSPLMDAIRALHRS